MILTIKNNTTFNAHKDDKKHFTLIFTLANQNLQNIVTNTIAESYNTHKYAGHSLLHPNVGVLLVLQPTAHSSKGIVAQINAAQILSKAHCSALHSTFTYPPGYAVPYVMDTGQILLGDEETILGTSHTYLSILKFADTAKDCKLYEKIIEILDHEVDPIKVTNEVIPIQWQPGSLKKEAASHPILSLDLGGQGLSYTGRSKLPQTSHQRSKKEIRRYHQDSLHQTQTGLQSICPCPANATQRYHGPPGPLAGKRRIPTPIIQTLPRGSLRADKTPCREIHSIPLPIRLTHYLPVRL